jgi:deoxyribodipyrimidine photolyase-related protein
MAHIVTIVFPHQLFQSHPAIQKSRIAYLVEDSLFFKQHNFRQQKLVLSYAKPDAPMTIATIKYIG